MKKQKKGTPETWHHSVTDNTDTSKDAPHRGSVTAEGERVESLESTSP